MSDAEMAMELEGSEDAELESPVPDSDGPESGPMVTPKKAKSKAAPKPSPSSSSKKVKPAKTAGGARHTSRPEKGKKDCRACGRRLELAHFQINQLNCTDCKKALDVISKKAREQNKKEWLAQQKSCPKKLKKMLLNYFAAVNAAKSLGNRRTTWSIASYMKSLECESVSRTTERGVMMWKQQALAYWESLAGGSLSSELAEAKWAELVATIDEHIHDQKGPTKAPLRFRVRTEDIVNLSSAYMKRKCLGSFVSVCPLFLFIVQVSLSLKLESLVCDLSLD